GIGGTPTGSGPLTWIASAVAGPQLPAISCARTQIFCTPTLNGYVSSAPFTPIVTPEPPSDSGVPAPAPAGALPIDHSAAAIALAPRAASDTVAVRFAPTGRTIGFGDEAIEPATTTGPRMSPPGRAIV